jgi:hypothetical protein
VLSTIRIVLSVYAVTDRFFSSANLAIYAIVALTGAITTWIGVQALRRGTKEAKRATEQAQQSAEDKARLALLDPYLATIEHLDKYGENQGFRVERLMEDLLECEEKNRELNKQLGDRASVSTATEAREVLAGVGAPQARPDYSWVKWIAGLVGGLLLVAIVAIGLAFYSYNSKLGNSNRLLELTTQERDSALDQVKALQIQIDCGRTRLADYLENYGVHIAQGDVAGIKADTAAYREALHSCVTKP